MWAEWLLAGFLVVFTLCFVAIQVWAVVTRVESWQMLLFVFVIMGDLPLFGIFLPGQLASALDATEKWRKADVRRFYESSP